jgi:hypothetical protein
MSNCVTQIRQYKALQQFSAKRYAQGHKMIIKDSLNRFYRNFNYPLHVMTFQYKIVRITISKFNLQALTQCMGNSAATCNVLLSGAYLVAPLSSQSDCNAQIYTT